MAFDVPSYNARPQQITLPDYSRSLSDAMSGMRQLQQLYFGTGAQQQKGDWVAIPDTSQPTGFRMQFVPGSTKESRAQNLALMQQQQARQSISADPAIQEKLNRLSGADVLTQEKILADIRQTDMARIAQQTGLPTATLFEAMLGDTAQAVRERKREVQDAAGWGAVWDSLKLGAKGLADIVGSVGESTPEKLARAEEFAKYREEIIAQNPYLQDQELRRAAGEGAFSRMTGSTGSVLSGVGSAVGEMLPTAGAMIASASAGTKAGGLLGGTIGGVPGAAIGGLVGGLTTGSGAGVLAERQAFINRVAADPSLSREEKLRAIDEGLTGAGLTGLAMGAIPMAAGPAGQLLRRGAIAAGIGQTGRAVAAAGTEEAAKAVLQKAATDAAAKAAARGVVGRLLPATAKSAAELTAMNMTSVLGQNMVYNAATGQNIPITEGLGEAIQQGLIAAPVFAAPRVGRRGKMPEGYDSKGRPITDQTKAATVAAAAAGQEAPAKGALPNMADQEFNRAFRTGLNERWKAGETVDPAAIKKSYMGDTRTEEQWRAFLENNAKVIKSARLPNNLVKALLEAEQPKVVGAADTGTIQGIPQPIADLTAAIRGMGAGDIDGAMAAVRAARESGVEIATLEKLLVDSAKTVKDLKADPGALITKKLLKEQRQILAEAIDNIRQEQGAADGVQATGERSGGAGTAAELGVDGEIRARAADTPDTLGNRGVAPDTGTATETAAARGVGEIVGSDQPVESRGVSRAAQPDVRAGEAAPLPAEAAGDGSIAGTDAGRGVGAAAALDATASARAGEPGRAGVGTPGDAGTTATAGGQPEPAGWDVAVRARAYAEAMRNVDARAARLLEESGQRPLDVVDIAPDSFQAPGTTAIADVAPALTPEVARAALAQLPPEVLNHFRQRNTGVDITPQIGAQRALAVLSREALGERLTGKQQAQIKALRRAGIGELVLPESIQMEAADARTMGMKTDASGMIEAGADTQTTIDKITHRIWCGAI